MKYENFDKCKEYVRKIKALENTLEGLSKNESRIVMDVGFMYLKIINLCHPVIEDAEGHYYSFTTEDFDTENFKCEVEKLEVKIKEAIINEIGHLKNMLEDL